MCVRLRVKPSRCGSLVDLISKLRSSALTALSLGGLRDQQVFSNVPNQEDGDTGDTSSECNSDVSSNLLGVDHFLVPPA